MQFYANKEEELTRFVYVIVKKDLERIGPKGSTLQEFYKLVGSYVLEEGIPRKYRGDEDPKVIGAIYEDGPMFCYYDPNKFHLSDLYLYSTLHFDSDERKVYLATIGNKDIESQVQAKVYDNLKVGGIIKDVSDIIKHFILINEYCLPKDSVFVENVKKKRELLYRPRTREMVFDIDEFA